MSYIRKLRRIRKLRNLIFTKELLKESIIIFFEDWGLTKQNFYEIKNWFQQFNFFFYRIIDNILFNGNLILVIKNFLNLINFFIDFVQFNENLSFKNNKYKVIEGPNDFAYRLKIISFKYYIYILYDIKLIKLFLKIFDVKILYFGLLQIIKLLYKLFLKYGNLLSNY